MSIAYTQPRTKYKRNGHSNPKSMEVKTEVCPLAYQLAYRYDEVEHYTATDFHALQCHWVGRQKREIGIIFRGQSHFYISLVKQLSALSWS